MSAAIEAMLASARGHVMSAKERRRQQISFVAGNVGLENPNVTPELVERIVAARLQEDGHE